MGKGGRLMQIRRGHVEDASVIARIMVQTWQKTYRGVVDDAFLNRLDPLERKEQWERTLEYSGHDKAIFVAVCANVPIGYAMVGKPRSESVYAAELYAIYILPEYQGKKVGSMLLNTCFGWAKERGLWSMYVLALKGNSLACHFYEAMGAKFVSEMPVQIGEQILLEVVYAWQTIPKVDVP